MKLNNQQISALKQLVDSDVKFSDTYVEVYDHVITALENQPEQADLTKAYNEIIDHDFGGRTGLVKLEDSYKKAFLAHMHSGKWSTMASYFRWPLLPGTILVACIVFFIANISGIRELTMCAILGFVVAQPGMMMMPRYMIKPEERGAKKTIRYGTLRGMGVRMYVLYIGLIACAFFANLAVHHYHLIGDTSLSYPILITIYFVFCTLYNISIFKNYRNVFNLPAYDVK